MTDAALVAWGVYVLYFVALVAANLWIGRRR